MRKKKIDAEELKQMINPESLFSDEGVTFRTHRSSGWVDGGLCPFHADRKAGSFKVNLDTGAFKCHSCGEGGGNVIEFYRQLYNISFREALERLYQFYVGAL